MAYKLLCKYNIFFGNIRSAFPTYRMDGKPFDLNLEISKIIICGPISLNFDVMLPIYSRCTQRHPGAIAYYSCVIIPSSHLQVLFGRVSVWPGALLFRNFTTNLFLLLFILLSLDSHSYINMWAAARWEYHYLVVKVRKQGSYHLASWYFF